MKLFDSHCHLDDEKFDDDRDEIIRKCLEENGCEFATVGYSLASSKEALCIAKKYNVFATCGISPNDIPQTEEELWKELDKLEQIVEENVNSKYLVAIGEIGLDYYWKKDNADLQRMAFIKQIELANKYNLPITIHTREAVNDTLEILKKHIVKNKGIFHCCPHNRELIKEGLKLGFYISFCRTSNIQKCKTR